MNQNTSINNGCSKRKFEMSSFEDQLIVKKHVFCQYDKGGGCNLGCCGVNPFSRSIIAGIKSIAY